MTDATMAEFAASAVLKQARSIADEARRLRAYDRLRILRDDHRYLIEGRATRWFDDETVKQVKPRLPLAPNALATVAQAVGTVYEFGVTRRARMGNETWQAHLRRLADDWGIVLDDSLAVANQIAQACNEAVVAYFWNAALDRPTLRVFGPDQVTAWAHPDNPTEALAIAYERARPRSELPVPGGLPREWVVWTPAWWRVYGRDNLPTGEGGENTIGMLPFLICHRERPIAIWDTTTGEDLTDASLTCPVLASLLIELAQTQTHLQLAIAGAFDRLPATMRTGPAEVLPLDTGATATVLNLQADPAVVIKNIDWQLDTVLSRRGIPRRARTLEWDATSGVSLSIQREPLRALRDAQVPRWRRYDGRLQRIIARTHGLPCEGFETDFGAWPSVLDMRDRLELARLMLSMGLISRADMAREFDPELTDAEATAKIDRNLQANTTYLATLASRNTPTDPTVPARTPEDNGMRGPPARRGPNGAAEGGRARSTP